MTRRKRKGHRRHARSEPRLGQRYPRPEPQANTTVATMDPALPIMRRLCGQCRKTTRTMALRTPITIMGVRVGEPQELRSCPHCGLGIPQLMPQTV